ncbi:hypothetical protein SCLCIDRAFT_1216351 [Scleroderma citrinum Foug A]|uniref:Carbohydrate-binding module family 18 protein n=1 Tax=Scleroderma citrinum Foug A TaxID=1036808 RepID=A0A0C3DK29_9AGAM|nr:hypothetical protein SCLCIDRAFT_1216351 [Scleroderma citrinum Foug A]
MLHFLRVVPLLLCLHIALAETDWMPSVEGSESDMISALSGKVAPRKVHGCKKKYHYCDAFIGRCAKDGYFCCTGNNYTCPNGYICCNDGEDGCCKNGLKCNHAKRTCDNP